MRLPPLNALRAFEAAARHLSFKRSAEELNVTQSAISHQVKALEEHLGMRLFLRQNHKITLTHQGADYLEEISDILDQLAAATDHACDKDASGPLFVRATPGFAARWLVPRLTAFHATYPRIELHISASLEPVDFASDQIDIDIRYGEDEIPGLRVDPLLSSNRFPVASPKLLKGQPRLRRPDDLRRFTLLHDEVGDGWQQWLTYTGTTGVDPNSGPRFEHCELVLRAAAEAQGVALAYAVLAEGDLASGLLVRLFDISLPPTVVYSVVAPRTWSDRPKIAAFRSWLLAVARTKSAPAIVPLRLATGV